MVDSAISTVEPPKSDAPETDAQKTKATETDAPEPETSQAESQLAAPEKPATPVELLLPRDESERDRKLSALELFCRVFPDQFFIDRRGRAYVENKNKRDEEEDVRLLSAGFHSMMGYFRDDQPLCELLLTSQQQAELDRLWFELDFIANAPHRQHTGFIWFERAEGRFLVDEEFDAYRSEDKGVTREEMIHGLRDVYLAKARRLEASEQALQAMQDHFQNINASIRAVEQAWPAALQAHIMALPVLAERAYRRPLTEVERNETIAFYHQLRQADGLGHEEAIRDVVVSILMSPYFCYRSHPGSSSQAVQPLPDYALANRLSYFLWSSMPDERLLQLASENRLHEPEIVRAEASRLLRDRKVRGLAVEFVGNWLGFRQFETHNSVDRSRFPEFNDELRQAMFEEPVQFALDVMQNNGSVLDFLFADHTFVNSPLAEHYGINSDLQFGDNGWTKISGADEIGRGGILPMSVFMTRNSPGLRTSPVKRGYWVVRQLLGEHIPPPPPGVPDLPTDESQLGGLTLRELLAKHREHASCAGCHEKFDSVGLVFEGYGPIGETRQLDLSGNAVDTSADFPDGSRHDGLQGLKQYLRQQRQDDFVNTLCRKLLSYALGRSLIITDQQLLNEMQAELREHEFRFESLVHAIVSSSQFLNQRGTTRLASDTSSTK